MIDYLSSDDNLIDSVHIEFDQNLRLVLEKGDFKLSEFVKIFGTVREFSLYSTRISEQFIEEFLDGFESADCSQFKVEYLDLYHNQVNAQCITLLCNLFDKYHGLKFLGLGKTGIGIDESINLNLSTFLTKFYWEKRKEKRKTKKRQKIPRVDMSLINSSLLDNQDYEIKNSQFEILDLRENDFSEDAAIELETSFDNWNNKYKIVLSMNSKELPFEIQIGRAS